MIWKALLVEYLRVIPPRLAGLWVDMQPSIISISLRHRVKSCLCLIKQLYRNIILSVIKTGQ